MDSAPQPGVYSAKDYEIKSLDLVNSGGQTISLLSPGTMIEMQIHQSVDAAVMFGTMIIVDGQDLLGTFAVSGNEYINILIDQPSLNLPLKKVFKIIKISSRENNNNAGAKYMVHFASDEQVISSTTRVSKAYKNKRISEIVYDILTNYLNVSQTKINRIDDTSGTYNIVIPSYRPIEAIHWASSRAYNTDRNYCYYFFESRDGFEFLSQQTLYKQQTVKKLVYDIKSVNETPNQSSDVARNRNSLEKFKVINDFDTINGISAGSFSSRLLSVNLFSQQFKYNDYSLLDAENEGRLLNSYKTINDGNILNGFYSNYKTYISTNDAQTEKENAVDKWLMNRQMHKNLIDNFKIRGVISGDITLKAGDIVEFKFPKYVAADESGKQFDEYRSGKFMLTDITHIFKSGDKAGNAKFETVLIMVSDSFSKRLPTAKNIGKTVKK
jgi:hypothetical protein